MSDYNRLARQLKAVRGAWKRRAALSGLFIVAMEALGILTVAFLVDWIYQPLPAVRIGIFAAVLVLIVALVVRHVVRPLLRRISDEQLALFIEEHNDKFEGSLITATELVDPQAKATREGIPQAFVDAVIRSATGRAETTNIRGVVELRRLRKYGLAAVVVLAAYGAMCLTVPGFAHHASRVLAPWNLGKDDEQKMDRLHLRPKNIQISLSHTGKPINAGGASVLRGSAFDLEAVLSDRSDEAVVLNFRPVADASKSGAQAAWRTLPMGEIDKVNGFKIDLPDVNEETEFFVSTGNFRSATGRVGVFDLLVVQGIEITTHYPAYLQVSDRTEVLPSGDVAVPEGSRVKVRVLTNSALTSGKLSWQDGSKLPMTVDGPDHRGASASFDVAKDGSYSFAISDGNGQTSQSPASFRVQALPDTAPTVNIKFPQGAVTVNPLGEVNFDVEATDDFGLASVELIYQRLTSTDTSSKRLPMHLNRAATSQPFPDVAQATARLAMEDLQPRVMPEEVFSYYIECTDRKGQKAVSDIHQIIVDHYEVWGTVSRANPHDPTYVVMKSASEYLEKTWALHQKKPTLPAEEFARLSKELGDTLADPVSKRVYTFYNPKKVPPEKRSHADKVDQVIADAYKSLLAADTLKAVDDFRVAYAELTIIGLAGHAEVELLDADFGKTGLTTDLQKIQAAMERKVIVEVDKTPPPPGWNPVQAKKADQIKKAAAELKQQQEEIANQAKQLAQAGGDSSKQTDKDKQKNDKEAKDLAGQQDKVSAKTKDEADKARATAATDPPAKQMGQKMSDAAKAMDDAAKHLKENKFDEAAADAQKAQKGLEQVAEVADKIKRENLAAAITDAENRAAKVLKEQKQLTKDTETVGKNDASKTDDAQEREFKKLAYKQAGLKEQVDKIKDDVKELSDWAKRDAHTDAAKQVENADKELTASQVDKKMTNAVVELTAKSADTARLEQAKAEKGLENVVVALQKAGDSLAADREAELKRAKEEAKQIEKGLAKLGATPRADTQPATGPAVASKDPSNDPSKDPSSQPATRPAGSKDPTAGTADKTEKPLTDQEKKDLADTLTQDIERLTRHLESRDFAKKDDTQFLKDQSKGGEGFAQGLKDDPRKRDEVADVIRRVSDHLEAEYLSQLQAKKLLAAQHEECPPDYRALVNKYYEALSDVNK